MPEKAHDRFTETKLTYVSIENHNWCAHAVEKGTLKLRCVYANHTIQLNKGFMSHILQHDTMI